MSPNSLFQLVNSIQLKKLERNKNTKSTSNAAAIGKYFTLTTLYFVDRDFTYKTSDQPIKY